MGKSTLAAQARRLNIPVHDADSQVHELMKPGTSVFAKIVAAFPDCLKNGEIDRSILGRIVFNDAEKRKYLESLLHPLVRNASRKFILQCQRRRVPFCILDIPLLFETGRDKDMDIILLVTAPYFVQKRRVLSRPNMTEDKFKTIVKTQMPDYRKRLRSDLVVQTARGRRHTLGALKKLKRDITGS